MSWSQNFVVAVEKIIVSIQIVTDIFCRRRHAAGPKISQIFFTLREASRPAGRVHYPIPTAVGPGVAVDSRVSQGRGKFISGPPNWCRIRSTSPRNTVLGRSRRFDGTLRVPGRLMCLLSWQPPSRIPACRLLDPAKLRCIGCRNDRQSCTGRASNPVRLAARGTPATRVLRRLRGCCNRSLYPMRRLGPPHRPGFPPQMPTWPRKTAAGGV